MANDWRPRLSINIDDDQYKKLQNLIPWGVKGQVFSIIIDDLIRLLETHGTEVLGAILHKKVTLEDYTSLIKEKEKK